MDSKFQRLSRTGVAAVALLSVAALAGCQRQPAGGTNNNNSSTSTPSASVTAQSSGQPDRTTADTPVERVVQSMRNSVVRVSVSGQSQDQSGPFGALGGPSRGPSNDQAQGTGTGMVLDDQGHILTNNHVVTLEGSSPQTAVSVDLPNGKTAQATVVGTDALTDLAVIQLGAADRGGLSPIKWADPSSIVVGQPVVAIGYALDLGGAPTVTTGVVSATNRDISETDATISGSIQTDAAMNPGNSGGPLLNDSSQVVGINTGGLSGTQDQPVQGLNFAISSQTAQPVVQALVSQGHVTRGYMGVGVTDVTAQLAKANNLGVTAGAGVGQVTSGGPADKAGLKAGDVITKVGDVPIANTGDLTAALTKYGPGQSEAVTYSRSGKQATATITLGQRPATG